MTRRTGGAARDRRILERRAIPALAERSLSSDVATNAVTATNVVQVPREVPKVMLEDADLLALVTGTDRIQPITVRNLLNFLESRYVLTPLH